jgi:alkanesulfonate monooxygenase SsuD/methylene tetrahydromethanopterin reductase-like flavin-dependent oxidoreductase (luciferase family)
MKFIGSFHFQVRPPYSRQNEQEAMRSMVELATLCEEVGFDEIQTPEHHFLQHYSHSSAPEVFLSAVAARTKTIKLMHGVRLLPHRYNNPIRAAEMAAALDILSEGRLVFGIGRSTTAIELDGFQIDTATSREQMREAMEVIFRAWGDGPVEYRGTHFSMPERNVIPKPVQQPHPPIFWAGGSPDSVRIAGRAGYGAACWTFSEEGLMAASQAYWEAVRGEAPPPGPDELVMPSAANRLEEFKMGFVGLCGTTSEAVDVGVEWSRWFLQEVLDNIGTVLKGEHRSFEYLQKSVDLTKQPRDANRADMLAHRSMVIGNPDVCIEKIKYFVDRGFNSISIMMNTAIPHRLNAESLRLFGQYVIPYFRSLESQRAQGESVNGAQPAEVTSIA